MLVPLSWLKQYVPVEQPPKELAHLLTMAGTEIGAIDEIGGSWQRDKVVVGHVLKVEPHPNADRLTLPTVDLGDGETAKVVCGAPNVAAGQKIAFAREGAMLYSYRSGKVEPLKAATIRGVVSAGMVSSELELGLSEEHEGILVLPDDAPIGAPLVDYLGDTVFDAEITPNRPDCLSILGIAREVAAVTGETVTEPDSDYAEEGAPIEEQARVDIADPELCHRYTASLVTGVTVGPSPRWLQDALLKVGQRSINNIVDITNYVMLEYGQPLHAFDFDTLKDGTIVVRAARPKEALLTLDDEMVKLDPPMLAIADSQEAVALAGVIGGVSTGVREGTTSVLLESANFDPVNTRRTAAALRIGTDASYRFERGIRAELAPLALKRATRLILDVAGGKAARGIIDLYPGEQETKPVSVSAQRIEEVLGVRFTDDQVERTLASLGLERSEPATSESSEGMWFLPPYWRSDISIEADLIEEVARIVGYDEVPTTTMSTPIPHHTSNPQRDLREQVRDLLVGTGMQETISHSVTSPEALGWVDALNVENPPLKLFNPMSSDMTVMRTSLRGSVLQTLASNRRVSAGTPIRIFEIGNVYVPKEEAKERDLPDEMEKLVGLLSGPRFTTSWTASSHPVDFFDAKGVLEAVLGEIGAEGEYEPSVDSTMHPGKTATVRCNGVDVGTVGEVHPSVLDRFDIDDRPVAMFDIDLESLYQAVDEQARGYAPVSRFPESDRDVAIVVNSDVTSAEVQRIIGRHKLVKESAPVDVYTGEGIPAGKKSVAYRIVFQSEKATLTAEAVDKAQGDILRQLEREIGAELRR